MTGGAGAPLQHPGPGLETRADETAETRGPDATTRPAEATHAAEARETPERYRPEAAPDRLRAIPKPA